MTITPEQHQIERMRAYAGLLAASITDRELQPDGYTAGMAAAFVDTLMIEFDARFPAPQAPPAPVEADWIPHTPGDPMPCDGDARVEAKLRNGDHIVDLAKHFDWRKMPAFSKHEILEWRPAR